jgi:DNA-cytosine methyltransferase
LTARPNRTLARKQDQGSAEVARPDLFDSELTLHGRLANGRRRINIVELFAGAGGMGLGFLMNLCNGPRFRVLFSGEIDPVFANTLRINHDFLRAQKAVDDDDVPGDTVPVDLRIPSVMDKVQSVVRNFGGVDIVIGGPPCQGFSNANRNSWSSKNPNNTLVETYLDYVVRLRPRVFIMENVQGIMWTKTHGNRKELSVAEDVTSRFAAAGYRIFPKLLDAAWYGVPQHRNRFFLLGIHADLGYAQDDFGEWGPFPRPSHGPGTAKPFVSVRDAIADLPRIENGASAAEITYAGAYAGGNAFLADIRRWAPCDVVWDHVTSRHAEYVIDRYSHIPAGGNWSDIAHMMTNYSAVERTHSNIYRRLHWDEASITIGQYRKAMLIHPEQNRGLSLREASRLQSFPDWFRFAGSEQQIEGGLSFKQQQVANAVSPLVTRAVSAFLLKL